jgi:hypothetical protein
MADKKISELTALTGANVATDDQLVIVDTSAALTKSITIDEFKNALDTATGFVRITGDTMTGDLSMGDNVKAIFGAGSDLQIYHNGSHSIIADVGTGNLNLYGENLNLQNSDGTENYIRATVNSDVKLYYDNAAKLATTSTGVEIKNVASGANAKLNITTESTGGGTSEILFSDNTTGRGRIYYDHGSSPEELHIETTGTDAIVIDNSQNVTIPNGNLDITGTLTADDIILSDANTPTLTLTDTTNTLTTFLQSGNSTAVLGTSTAHDIRFQANSTDAIRIANGGDISFYEDTGTTAKFFWDASAESLGIGTTSPSAALEIGSTTTIAGARLTTSAGSDSEIEFINTNSGNHTWAIGQDFSNSNVFSIAYNNAVGASLSSNSKVVINTSGNVGIGTDSPSHKLHVSGTGSVSSRTFATDTTGDASFFAGNDNGQIVGPLVYGSGKAAYGALGTSETALYSNRQLTIMSDNASGIIKFATGGNDEAMRIDSSGNVGIGTSPSTVLHINDASDPILRLQRGGAAYSQFQSDSAGSLYISADAGNSGASSRMQFNVDGSEAMRIDSSGNLLVGTTNSTPGIGDTDDGAVLGAAGWGFFSKTYSSADSSSVLYVGRNGTDGNIINIAKDGSTVGSIGVEGGDLVIGTGTNCGLQFNDGNAAIRPFNIASNAAVDNAVDLGVSGTRFKDLYLSGGVYLGGTAAANKLEDYEEGTWTPTATGSTSGTMSINVPRARYIKVGQMVTASATISFTSGSTGVGGLRIFGLPGLPATTSQVNLETHGACMLDAVNFGQTYQTICCYIFSGANYLNLYGTVNNASWEQLQVDPFINGTALQFTAIYQTNN